MVSGSGLGVVSGSGLGVVSGSGLGVVSGSGLGVSASPPHHSAAAGTLEGAVHRSPLLLLLRIGHKVIDNLSELH